MDPTSGSRIWFWIVDLFLNPGSALGSWIHVQIHEINKKKNRFYAVLIHIIRFGIIPLRLMSLYCFTVSTSRITLNKGDFLNDANTEQDLIKYLKQAVFVTKKGI